MEHLPLGPPITIKPIVLRSIAVFLATLILIPTLLLILRPGTAAAWFDDSYAYRQKITFTHNANLTDASMRLTVSNTDTLVTNGKMQGDCDDSRFTDGSGKLLRFKLVSGCNSASTVYDVLFPIVLNGSNLAYFYYGNPSAVSASDNSVPDGTVPSGTPSFGTEEKGPSPALYLKFDEGYGATTQDTTSNNNDGAISGAAWKTRELCLFENCLFFDGTDDVVTVTNADSLDMDRALAAGMTYQAWVRVNSDGEGSVGQIFNKGTNTYLRIINEGADAAADVEASLALATSNATVTITDGIALNTWTHIALTYTDDADDEITVYVNGTQKGASVNGSGAPAADANNLLIGGPTTANFHGFLDEWKVYPVERTSEQIKTDTTKAASLHGAAVSFGDDQSFISQGLLGYWKLDETSGNASDSSGNGVALTNNNTTPFNGGKFGSAPTFQDSLNHYFNAGSTISGVKSVSFWASPSATTDEFINLTGSVRVTASSGTVSFTGATTPQVYVNGVLNGAITADTWNHIVAVTTTPVNADAFEVGRANSAYTNGKIDDVRLYNRSLTLSEVERLHDWGPSPVGWWKLDENQGASAFDSSGNANTGTLTNGPKWSKGKLGQDLEFDGADDYVSIFDSITPPSTYQNLGNNDTYTVSAWIQTSRAADTSEQVWRCEMTIIELRTEGVAQTQVPFGFGVEDSFLCLGRTANDNNSDSVREQGTVAINDGAWHHVAAVINTPGNTVAFYVDGTLDQLDTFDNIFTNTSVAETASNMAIGAASRDAGQFDTELFQGLIDDVRVYNYALTPKQIVSVMNADHPSVGSPVGSAVGHWKFDEGFGTIANNSGSAGSTINGTLTGMDSPATYGSGWTNHGKFAKALNFDGINDYVAVPGLTSINPTIPFTATTWVFLRDTASEYSFISQQDGTGTGRTWLGVSLGGGTPNKLFSFIGGSATYSTSDLTAGVWHHIILTSDGSTIRLYIDGIPEGSGTPTPENATGGLIFGAAKVVTLRNMNGSLDDIRIYNSTLSPDEVKLEYNQAKAIVLGSLSTHPDGITASNSAARAYCPPGDTATCNPPIAHWTFDENGGANANDITGNANTGTLTNGPQWTEGKLGQALGFDGTDDYVDVGTVINYGASNFTLSAWINAATINAGDQNTFIGQDGTTDQIRFEIDGQAQQCVSSALRFVSFTAEATAVNDCGTTSLATGRWYHVAVTVDSTNDVLVIYLNGVEDGSNTNYTATIQSALEPTNIGRVPVVGQYFNGLIDDVRIYNYARTPAQIAWEYNQGKPIGHWKLDECQGSTAYDASGRGNNGTITIGATGSNTASGTCNSGTATEAWNNGTTGKFNASLDLDGTNDYVTIGDMAEYDFGDNQDFTASTWVKTSINPIIDTYPIIISKEGGSPRYGFNILANVAQFESRWRGEIYVNGTIYSASGATDITDGNWHHVVFQRQGSTLITYEDGKLANSTEAVSTSIANALNLRFGIFSHLFSGALDGSIDDIRIYNYALTPAQIKTVYNEGSAIRFGPLTGSP